MRIIVVDDDMERHDEFSRRFDGHDVLHFTVVEDALKAFESNAPFDLAHLDHDLGILEPKNMVEKNGIRYELTGAYITRYLATELPAEKRPFRVVVHSWNPAGAKNMMADLKEANIPAQYVPFCPAPKAWSGE